MTDEGLFGRADLARRVAANYFYWQGLRLVPFGILALVAAAGYSPLWPPDVSVDLSLLIGLALALLAFAAAGRYYERNFGRAAERVADHSTRTRVKWLAVYPAMVGALVLDVALAPPLFMSGVVWATGVVLFWASTGWGRPHYLAIAAGTALLTPLPALGIASPGTGMLPVFLTWFGVAYVVAGVLDHLELRRALSAVGR